MAAQALDAAMLRRVIVGFHDGLVDHRHAIDNLNVYPVPDGDTGANMMLTMRSVLDELKGVDGVDHDMAPLCAAISKGALMGARGNSGVILAQIMRGFCSVLADASKSSEAVAAGVFSQAMTAASEGAYRAVAKPVEGTILTVVREAAEAAEQAANDGIGLVEVIDAARERGYDALIRTPQMLAVLAEAGVVDAGGAGLLLMLDAFLSELDARPMPEPPETAPAPAHLTSADAGASDHAESSIADLRYEVMFLLDADDSDIDGFKRSWTEVGDSIVVVGGDGLWNCHIHTDHIGAAIEAAIAIGRPHRIAVTDLLDQAAEHSESFAEHGHGHHHGFGHGDTASRGDDQLADADQPTPESHPPAFEPVEITEADRCAVVAVGAGSGVQEILLSMGADRVVAGGQSMNPSTADLLAAVESLPSGQVVVLPNNKNIIAVAEQVDALTERSVSVVRTRSVMAGIACLVSFSSTTPAARNAEVMSEAADSVIVGEITQAVRDAPSPAGAVRTGDWLGLDAEGIVAVASDAASAATSLLDRMIEDHHELLTVIVGADADPSVTDAIESHVNADHPDVEVEVSEGRQPLYPYLFGLE